MTAFGNGLGPRKSARAVVFAVIHVRKGAVVTDEGGRVTMHVRHKELVMFQEDLFLELRDRKSRMSAPPVD